MTKYRLKQDFMNMEQDQIVELNEKDAQIMKDRYKNHIWTDLSNVPHKVTVLSDRQLQNIIKLLQKDPDQIINDYKAKDWLSIMLAEYAVRMNITKDLIENNICDIKDVIDFLEETKMIPLKKEKVNTCCICGEILENHGNNPQPFTNKGQCCDNCNVKYVIPARLEILRQK